MDNQRLFMDVHAIQTLPPSNINRDDAGSPKTAQYGGTRRARVSSQAWKHAMRLYFENNSAAELGKRTKNVAQYVADCILELDGNISQEEAFGKAIKVLNDAGIKAGKDGTTKALFFIGKRQAMALGQAAINNVSDKKELQKLVKQNPAIDIALFGRMVADDPTLNEDASAQVAHAISTHSVQNEFDYFTAVDDLSAEDNAGAGMLGTIEYNSSTLYRYANVAVHELIQQLGDPDTTIKALQLFIEAFSNSLPSGKVNTFANDTLPQAIVVTVRDDRPVNLVSAYEKPVISKEGYVEESINRLFSEYQKAEKFVHKPLFTLYITRDDIEEVIADGIKESDMDTLIKDFAEQLRQHLN